MTIPPSFRASALAVLAAAALSPAQAGWSPDRRRAQFQTDSGYAVFPYVYSLPGIGKGVGLLGGVTNVGGTHADLAGTFFAGDVNGQAVGVNSVHLLPRRLILDFGGVHLDRMSIQSYFSRGMASSKEDHSLAEFGSALFGGGRLTATFLDRRAEGFLGYYGGRARFTALRDRDGNRIAGVSGESKTSVGTPILGGRLDLTDDYVDPRRGLLVEPSVTFSPRRGTGPGYHTTDASLTAYVPVGSRNTWAFNFFRSDAHVTREGRTDPSLLADGLGLDCEALPGAAAQAQCRQYAANAAAENAHGSATSLGGLSRLRSYPTGRFQGAHTEFIGTEFRWNVSDRTLPFNVYFMKDIRTALQIAFFYELGSVADQRGQLWKKARSTYGAGLRLATASGLVYRMDFAAGQEGAQPSIFFQYPWQL